MDSLPVHIRISSLTPTNEDVDARRAAIGELSTAWGKISEIPLILTKVEEIAACLGGDGQPAESLGLEVQEALQKHASAFLYTECPLDVGVCAGVAAMSILGTPPGTSGWTISDVYSNGLWAALSFQSTVSDEKREKLRREVLSVAQRFSRSSANNARERAQVPDMGDLAVTIAEGAKPTTTFKKATGATIDALRRNAALDREELDFLWWVQLNRSRLLNRSNSNMTEPLRIVVAGLESASHLRRLPADLHYDLVLRTLDKDPELDLKELMDAVGDDRKHIADTLNTTRVTSHATVFPLLNAIITGNTTATGAAEKRKVSTWGGRALLEAGLLRVCDNGAFKV